MGPVLLALLTPGCREIPPRIPEGYETSEAAPGWPPPAAYDPDPFHPANRWFHRTFGGRTAAGDIIAPRGDEAFGRLDGASRVDVAELGALLEEALRAPPPLRVDAFRSDALHEAARWDTEARPDAAAELVPLLLAAARRGEPDAARGMPPPPAAPPLREGSWTEEPPPGSQGLLPSPEDPRWTRRLRSGPKAGGPPTVLIRLRAALGPEGDPEPSPLPTECWELARENGEPRYRVWRFDRTAWTAGGEPWREIGPSERIAIRDPVRAGGVLEGEMRALCAGCHGPGAGEVRASTPAPRSQEELVAESLEDVLGSDGE